MKRPIARWPQPDFLPPRSGPGWRAWAALLLAALSCAVLGREALLLGAEQRRLDASLAVAERLRPPPPRRAPLRAAVSPQQELAARRSLQAVQQQLDADWRAPWLALEGALPAGVQLLSLELGGDSPRIEGLAPSADSALQLGERLSARPGLGPLVLTRLQPPAAGDRALRFELSRRRGAPA